MIKASWLISVLVFLAFSFKAKGQEADTIQSNKIITNAQMISIGAVNILDTYLSPEKYTGTELRYMSHTIREREGSRWSRLLLHQGNVSYSNNRADNANFVAGAYTFSYGVHYNWNFLDNRLNIKAGAQADVNLGFLYSTRNSNNPAQAKLSLDISPSASATYRFRLWNRPFSLRYEASVPFVGIMFSPNYGQSYYEIFTQGNYDHNVVPTTLISTPSLRQMLTLDFTLNRTTLRVGYLGDYRQSDVNSLKYHSYSNMFVIGIVRHFKLTKIVP
ncbi:MAG: DUF3316 domain-containing protein [Prevotellaceae bacterium]|nr:DUF3316 domain-containing protein [Prevotellaceae bacterium]